MSLVSSCPECAKLVSLPSAAPEARVRCPNCSAEYELRRALDLVPPMLQLLDEPAPFGNGFAVAPALSAIAEEHRDIAGSFDKALDLGESQAVEDDNNDELDTEVEGSVPLIDEVLTGSAGIPPELPLDLPADSSNLDLDQIDFDEPSAFEPPTEGARDEDEIAVEEPDDAHAAPFTPGAPGISPVSSALKRRKREPSFIGNLIGVVGGGVVGCSLAYFIVLWIGGPEKDFLEFGKKLPKWMLPPSFSVAAAPTPVTPMPATPAPADLDEVKQAANRDEEPLLKINVPALPDKPAEGEDLTNATKLPFETEPPATPEDPAAKQPAPEEAKPATPFKQPVQYSAAELEQVLADVKQLAAQASEGQPTRKQLLTYFRKLYRLGEVATFATDADAAKQQVNTLLATMAADPAKLPEIGRNGAGFFGLSPEKQGDDKGVLLAGDVEATEAVGALHRITLMPAGGKKPISIYSATDPGLRQGGTVLVLGSIINDPKAALNDFTGDEPRIVWLGASVIAGK